MSNNKQTKKPVQWGSKHDSAINNSRRQPSTGQKKEDIGRFSLFLYRGINTAHKFSCTFIAVCLHITCTVTTVTPMQHHLWKKKTLKKFGPLLWVGFDCFKARATLKRQFIFYQKVPRNSWYSFYQPQKDERLSQPWGYPVEHGAPELGIQHLIDH